MKRKNKKLLLREIIFMIWGFLGSSILGFLLIGNGLNYFTGNAILNTTAKVVGNGLIVFGILFIVVLFVFVNFHKIDKEIKN